MRSIGHGETGLSATMPLGIAQRWWVLLAATVGMALGFGVISSVSVFMAPLEQEMGWSRAGLSMSYTLMTVGVAFGGVLWGRVVDSVDVRWVAASGALVLSAGLFVLGLQSSLLVVQAVSLVVGAAGFACLYAPLLATVGLWFDRRRGLAIGIVTAGGALGQGLVPFLARLLISEIGWRDAYLVMGAAYLVILVPAMLTVTRPRAAAGGPAMAQTTAAWRLPVRTSITWLSVAAFFCCFCMAVPIVHMVTLLCDFGHAPSIGAGVLLTIMLSAAAGRVSFGMLADRIGALPTYAIASFVQAVTIYWLAAGQSLALLVPIAVVFGFGYAGNMTSMILCVREATPAHMVGRSTAIVSLSAWLGMGAGGVAGGIVYDLSGSYLAAFALGAAAGAASLVVAGIIAHLRARSDRSTVPALPSGLPASAPG